MEGGSGTRRRRSLALILAGVLLTAALGSPAAAAARTPTQGWALASSVATALAPEEEADNKAAIDWINARRASVGLAPFQSDPLLVRAAKNHLIYVSLNKTDPSTTGLNANGVPNFHYETAGKPGFTGVTDTERYAAVGGQGFSGGLGSGGDPVSAMAGLLNVPLHRLWLLSTYTKGGFARYDGRAQFQIAGDPTPATKVVVWPYAGMTRAPREHGAESPDPVPAGTDRSNGIGIAITAQLGMRASFVSFTLKDADGQVVPTTGANAPPYYTEGIRFPIGRLKPSATYSVSAKISSDAGTEDRTWSFTTVGSPPTLDVPVVRATPGGARIQWADPAGGLATGFELRRYSRRTGSTVSTLEWSVRLPSTARFFVDGSSPSADADAVFWTVLPVDEDGAVGTTFRSIGLWAYQLRPATAEWHSRWVKQAPYPRLRPGEVTDLWIDFVNLGNQPWVRGDWSAEAHLALNGDDQRPATVWGMNPGSWLSADRLATHDEPVVRPGEVGRFRFRIRAPSAPGDYPLNLRPVVDGRSWLEDDGIFFTVSVVDPAYHSKWVTQSPYPTLTLGATTTVSITFQNTGTATWARGTLSEAHLGLNLDDRTVSDLGMAVKWLAPDRPAAQTESAVGPGQNATFTFQIRGTKTGDFLLHLRPVIDGIAWMEDEGVFFLITVR